MSGGAGQAPGHERDHGDGGHGFVGIGASFVVADQAAAAVQPAQGAFDDPTAWQDHEALHVVGALDDRDRQPDDLGRPDHQSAAVPAVRPDHPDRGKPFLQNGKQPTRPVTVLD